MKSKRGFISISTIIFTIIVVAILLVLFNIYKNNYFNGFSKAVTTQQDTTKLVRDSKVKYSNEDSYKIINEEYNDTIFYKEIEVEPNTPYRVSCMVKTENVVAKNKEDAGAMIWLMDTYEYSVPITGTQDWQKIELIFDSKNRKNVKIAFRLGGNQNSCSGTAWFTDFKLEKGAKHADTEWNVGCFILKNLDVNIDGVQNKFEVNSTDIRNVYENMERYKNAVATMSKNQMSVVYDIHEIEQPLTTISYEDEHGYYIAPKDTKDLIYDIVKEKEYDHVFVVARMEDEEGIYSIPIKGNWVGLGAIDMYGIGYSIIRINKNGNTSLYEYNTFNKLPEEVYIHEFLHSLERTMQENGYEIPALHDYEKYGYTEDISTSLKQWYSDYMAQDILDTSTGKKIGLYSEVYLMKPYHDSDFTHSVEIEFNKEPSNILEEFNGIFKAIKSVFVK